MDEGSGTVANDGGALPANNAHLTGTPTWVAGQSGGAISLNGTTQYGATPDEASLDIANQITLAAWIRPAAAGDPGFDQKGRDGCRRTDMSFAGQRRRLIPGTQKGFRPLQPGDIGQYLPGQLRERLPV